MDLVSIFSKMGSGEMTAHSELGTRDESKQTRSFGTRIQKLKTVTGLNARVLAMKDIVVPFNPFTGEVDETYTKKTPFRPILLASQTIQGIWDFCKEHPEVAAKWERYIGVDMTQEGLTLRNIYDGFKKAGYVLPRVMTYHTVAMDFGGIHGFPEFRVKYTVDPTQLNDDGTYDYGPGAPAWHQAAIFYNGLLKPEADSQKKALEAQGASKEQISTARRAVYSKSPVGFVGPTNLLPFFYFPFGSDVKEYGEEDFKGVEEALRFYSFTDKWLIPLKEAMEQQMFDSDIDFYDFHIKTPSSKDTKPGTQTVYTDEDSMELYTAMQITNTDGRLALHGGSTQTEKGLRPNEEVYASFIAAARAYFLYSQEQSGIEGGETFEKIMASSNRFRPITTVLDSFLPACNEVFINTFSRSPYLTEEYKKQHHEFFVMMNPENAVALADADDDELEEAAKGAQSSVTDLIADAAPKEDLNLEEMELQVAE